MRATLNRDALLAAVSAIGRATDRARTMPILANVCLHTEGEWLHLGATDLDVTLRGQLPAKVVSEGAFTVPADLFLRVIKSLPSGVPIEVAHDATGTPCDRCDATGERETPRTHKWGCPCYHGQPETCTCDAPAAKRETCYACKGSKALPADPYLYVRATWRDATGAHHKCEFKLHGIQAVDFPKMPDAPRDYTEVDPVALREVLSACLPFASTDETRHAINGVRLVSDGETLTGYATDGHRLAHRSCATPGPAFEATLPRKAAVRLKAALEDAIDVALCVSAGHLHARVGGVDLSAKLIDHPFGMRAIDAIRSGEFATEVEVDRKALLVEVKALRKVTGRDGAIVIGCNQGGMRLTLDGDATKATRDLACTHTGEPAFVGLNARYLAETLARCLGATVNLRFNGPVDPVGIGEAYVMPMRVGGDVARYAPILALPEVGANEKPRKQREPRRSLRKRWQAEGGKYNPPPSIPGPARTVRLDEPKTHPAPSPLPKVRTAKPAIVVRPVRVQLPAPIVTGKACHLPVRSSEIPLPGKPAGASPQGHEFREGDRWVTYYYDRETGREVVRLRSLDRKATAWVALRPDEREVA